MASAGRDLDQHHSPVRRGRSRRTGTQTADAGEAWDSAALATACGRGDQRAWHRLIELYGPIVWTVARSFGLSHADSEDACQQTWIRVVEHVDRLREPAKLSSWLVTIARREALDVSRRRRRHIPVGDSQVFASTADTGHTVEDEVVDRLSDPRVAAAFRRLEEGHQALLAMLLQEPALSYDEISAALGIPRGSIGPTRNRLLRRLKQAIEPQLALAG